MRQALAMPLPRACNKVKTRIIAISTVLHLSLSLSLWSVQQTNRTLVLRVLPSTSGRQRRTHFNPPVWMIKPPLFEGKSIGWTCVRSRTFEITRTRVCLISSIQRTVSHDRWNSRPLRSGRTHNAIEETNPPAFLVNF